MCCCAISDEPDGRLFFRNISFTTFLPPLLLVFCRSITIYLPIDLFETAKVQEAFGLNSRDFKGIVLNAVDYVFTNEETKTILRERLRAKLKKI
jgi:hypothetical protein